MSHVTNVLEGKTIAVARSAEQGRETGRLISEKGAIPHYFCAIETKGLSDLSSVRSFIGELMNNQVDYVIFTSANGVKYLMYAAEQINQVVELKRGLARVYVIAVGPHTSSCLAGCHIRVDLVPFEHNSEGLVECLRGRVITGKRICIPRGTAGRPLLVERLCQLGAEVVEVPVYEADIPEGQDSSGMYDGLLAGRIDAVIFGSGLSAVNTVRSLSAQTSLDVVRQLLNEKTIVVAIGPVTAVALNELGVKVDVVPEEASFEKALLALSVYWHGESSFSSDTYINL